MELPHHILVCLHHGTGMIAKIRISRISGLKVLSLKLMPHFHDFFSLYNFTLSAELSPTDTVQSPTRAAAQEGAPPVVSQTQPDQSQLERLYKGNKPQSIMILDQSQSSSKSQFKNVMRARQRN